MTELSKNSRLSITHISEIRFHTCVSRRILEVEKFWIIHLQIPRLYFC